MSEEKFKKVRIDKWLWAVRAFKSRSIATNACSSGKVKIDGTSVKASRLVLPDELIEFKRSRQINIWKVIKLIDKRVGAKEAVLCYEDLSPKPNSSDRQSSAFYEFPEREKGQGRPTKRERRDIDKFRDL